MIGWAMAHLVNLAKLALLFSLSILVVKWKIICNAELIVLQDKALRTYMNFNFVLSCFHNQVMQ